jgi:hypothetical protein
MRQRARRVPAALPGLPPPAKFIRIVTLRRHPTRPPTPPLRACPGLVAALLLMTGCASAVSDPPPPSAPAATAPPAPAMSPAPSSRNPDRAATEPPAGPARQAGIAEVTVETRSLSGFWRVTGPTFIDFSAGLLSGVRIRYGAETADRNICLIEEREGSLTGICSAGIAKPAIGERDRDRVVLRWWNGPMNVIFEGVLHGPRTIRGSLSGGVIGLSVTGEVPMSLTRIDPDDPGAAEPESAAAMRATLADMAAGSLPAARYGPEAIEHLKPAMSRIRVDGAVTPVFLGRIHIRWQQRQAEKLQDVYRVVGPRGSELCRIALAPDGIVADGDCRSLEDDE